MTAQDLQQLLYDLLAEITVAHATDGQQIDVPHELLDPDHGIDWVSTFAEAGVLTSKMCDEWNRRELERRRHLEQAEGAEG